MPNVKFYVDERVFARHGETFREVFSPIRDMLCAELGVDRTACHLVALPVNGMDDQPGVNIELMILPRADRTPEKLHGICQSLRGMVGDLTGAHVAVRIATLDPQTYVALK